MMKLASLIRKEDYRFALLLAIFLHLLLFAALLLNLRHSIKLSLPQTPASIIRATTVDASQLAFKLSPSEEKKTPIAQMQMPPKPELVAKSPVKLPVIEKKQVPTMPKPFPTTKTQVSKKKIHSDEIVAHKALTHDKANKKLLSPSLKLAQKDVQQLLQQEVNTITQKKQTPQHNNAVTEKYRNLILQSIARQWIVPPDLDKHLEAKLAIHLAPGGMVLSVVVIKPSGNAVLDRSAQTAVFKASPLPVPKKDLFNSFRQINLTVRPEGLLTPS
jgi:colicin import membrane protein